MQEVDLLIIGAGPAGIAVAGEARAAGIPASRIAVIERAEQHSASIRSLYPPAKPVTANYKLPRSLRGRIHFGVTSAEFVNEDVLVVGGGDSAAEYSQHLVAAGNRVTLSYRRAEFTRMLPANRAAVIAAEAASALDVWRSSSIRSVEDDGGRPAVICDRGAVTSQRFDRIVYALGGTTPTEFLRSIGVEVDDGLETNVPGLYLAGDLVAGQRGGSIVHAFNSSRRVMRIICDDHLGCQLATAA